MDHPSNPAKDAVESVNPREQELSSSEPSKSNIPNEPTEALLRISQDMARVLDRLVAPKAPIDTVRRHGAEEFHGSSMEELEKAEFWLEKLERVLERLDALPIKEHHVQSHYCRVRHTIGGNWCSKVQGFQIP